MDDDLTCPECHHPLGLHQYFYGTCQAPAGGSMGHDRCGCIVTLHGLIKNLYYELRNTIRPEAFKELMTKQQSLLDEIAKSHMLRDDALRRVHFLETLIEEIAVNLRETKEIKEERPLYSRFTTDYRNEMQVAIEKMLLQTEKSHE